MIFLCVLSQNSQLSKTPVLLILHLLFLSVALGHATDVVPRLEESMLLLPRLEERVLSLD